MKTNLILLLLLIFSGHSALAEPTRSHRGHYNAHTIALDHKKIRQGISDQEPWVGLVGDSGITGAAISEDIEANWGSLLWNVLGFALESKRTVQKANPERIPHADLFGVAENIEPLVRVLYSQEEFAQAKNKGEVVKLNLEAKASLRLDIPEYSFGYLAARGYGIPAHRIVIAAQDGKRVSSLFQQMQRFTEVSDTLPSTIIVSYTANDICGSEMAHPLEQFQTDFENKIRQQLELAVSHLSPHPKLGTQVIIMAPMDVVQILTEADLMAQKVAFQGNRGATCRDIRFGQAAKGKLGEEMQKTLKGMCRSILSIKPTEREKIALVEKFQETQMATWKKVLSEFNNLSGWSFQFNNSSRHPQFTAGDLANDCFHPGPGAHSRIAAELLRSLQLPQ